MSVADCGTSQTTSFQEAEGTAAPSRQLCLYYRNWNVTAFFTRGSVRCNVHRSASLYCLEGAHLRPVAYPEILFGAGGSTNSVEDRENGDLGAVAP